MIKHIVFFNFKDYAQGACKADNIRKAKAMLDNLVGRVPTLLSMCAGPNAIQSQTAWDFALVAEFADAEALKQYVEHPEHRRVSQFMSEVRANRASVDLEF